MTLPTITLRTMAFLTQLAHFSLFLKIAWGGWLVAGYALIVWRRRGRTLEPLQQAIVRPRKAHVDAPQKSKRRWRLRANEEAPVLQSSSLLGLQ